MALEARRRRCTRARRMMSRVPPDAGVASAP
jgi:hypothetical protein